MHLINSIRFEVSNSELGEARDLQDKIFNICRHTIERSFNDLIEQYNLNERVDEMTLDLGSMTSSSLDSQFIPKLLEAFENKLRELADSSEFSKPVDLLEEVKVYLEKGVRHWTVTTDMKVDQSVLLLIQDQWSPFLDFLRRTRFQSQVTTRLANELDMTSVIKFIERIQPSESAFILEFIEDSQEASQRIKGIAIHGNQLRTEIIQIVLFDLIKSYGSYFNRKMFIRSQLIGMSMKFGLDYLELLRMFDSVLTETTLSFRLTTTLPALIGYLLNETIVLAANEAGPPSEEPWRPLIDTGVGMEEKEFLIENWKGITRSFAGEIALSLRRTVKNTDHIDYIIKLLGDGKTEDLIAILEPYDTPVILTFKHRILKNNELESELKYRQSDITAILNQLILGFILMDRGSRFNRKQFLKHQVFGLSQRLNVSLQDMVKFIKMVLENHETNTQVSELITLLREILEDELAVSYAAKELDLEEQMEILKKHLINQSGGEEWKYKRIKIKFFRTISKDTKLSRELIGFISNHADTVICSVDQLDDETFLFLFEFLAKEKLSLRGSEKDELMNQLSHRLKKHTHSDFRRDLFSSLLDYRKLTRELIVLHDLDLPQNRLGTLTYSYFIALINQDGKGAESVSDNTTNQLLNQKIWKTLGQTDDPFVNTWIKPSKMVLQLVSKEGISPRLFTTLVSKDWEELANTFSETEWSQLSKHVVRFLVSHFQEFSLDMPHQLPKPMFLELLPMVRQFLSEMHVKKSQMRKWNAIIGVDKQDKALTSSKASDQSVDYLEVMSKTLETGRLPQGISIKSLSDKIIEWHSKGNKHFTRIVKNRILSLEGWIQFAKILEGKILLRIVQVYTGSQFNHYMSASKDTEYLLKRGLKDGWSKFDDEYTWAARLFLAQRVGTTRTRVEELVQRHVVLLSGTSSQKHKEIIDELVAGLMMVKKEIQPASLRKRVDSILAMMQNTPEEVPEILSTTEEEIKAPLYVNNAGIILLWPYLNMLFKRAGLLDEQGAFRDLDAKRKAVWFLQYVGSGSENGPEYACTLTKLLCGLPLESPLGQHLEISNDMKELSDGLLEAVILNWGELNNTSIDGLRNSFLVRNGSLERDGSDWLLKVERKGFDVLLQTLPWSISNVKLPWMDGVIYVYWC